MSPSPLYIGIDAGGTKTIILSNTGDQVTSHGANLTRDGVSQTAAHLASLIQKIVPSNNVPFCACAGVAGAGPPSAQTTLCEALKNHFKGLTCSIHIIPDASIAFYAAHKEQSGILLITGTGSIFWARTKTGKMVRSGGWGSLLGDEGGGFQLGLAALRAVTHEIDGGPSTSLSNLLCEHHKICNSEDVLKYAYQQKEKISLLAPIVLKAALEEDSIAKSILNTQLLLLAKHFDHLLLAHPHIAPRISLMGGLTNDPFYVCQLQEALLNIQQDLTFLIPTYSPVQGALQMASKLTLPDST